MTVPGQDEITPKIAVPEITTPEIVGALSPSRAGDFMTCPLLYRFRVIDQLPERPSPAAVRGTLVHAVLERLYDLPAAELAFNGKVRWVELDVGDAQDLDHLVSPEERYRIAMSRQ